MAELDVLDDLDALEKKVERLTNALVFYADGKDHTKSAVARVVLANEDFKSAMPWRSERSQVVVVPGKPYTIHVSDDLKLQVFAEEFHLIRRLPLEAGGRAEQTDIVSYEWLHRLILDR